MKTRLTSFVPFVLTSLLVFVSSGCSTDMRGGGWIPSPSDPEAKANFGFQLRCDTETNEVEGQLEWHDHASGVHFHAEPDLPVFECSEDGIVDGIYEGAYVGTYEPQPKRLGEGGLVIVVGADNGVQGQGNEDAIGLLLVGGVYDGYVAEDLLGGGNISFKP